MLDAELELSRLKWRLQDRGYTHMQSDMICDAAREEIATSTIETITAATADAVTYAESIGAEEFISDIDVVPEGSSFSIRTRSGKTDYSTERVENLNNLLKNAKTSSDGSRYKVIPIKNKPKMGTSSFNNMIDQNKAAAAAREALKEKRGATVSQRATAVAEQFRASISSAMTLNKQSGDVTFRTASSKQNSESDWVIPEKDRDMTQYLIQLNEQIRDSIQEMIHIVISRYDQEYY